MRIAILGTGTVGRTLADRLMQAGHNIIIGTRDPEATLARTSTDARGQIPLLDWLRSAPPSDLPECPALQLTARSSSTRCWVW
jgi:predicted dinucleotide-binding enzyme